MERLFKENGFPGLHITDTAIEVVLRMLCNSTEDLMQLHSIIIKSLSHFYLCYESSSHCVNTAHTFQGHELSARSACVYSGFKVNGVYVSGVVFTQCIRVSALCLHKYE